MVNYIVEGLILNKIVIVLFHCHVSLYFRQYSND